MEKNEMYHEDTEMIGEPIRIAMDIILHAGNARSLIYQASDQSKELHFDKARELMKQAEEELNCAHIAQTGYIQKEASGETIEYSILFTHAQDTLMTIVSEHNMMNQMLDMIQTLLAVIEGKK